MMGQETTIPWCHHTWNPVWGCTKVDRGCKHCYAEAWATRWGHDVWGPKTEFREFPEKKWLEPLSWNRKAAEAGIRPRVFPSMCDPFDKDWPADARRDFWELIRETPRMDWLLLTKRPENIKAILPKDWGFGWSNVWLIASAHDQRSLSIRAALLSTVPAIVRGISLEPLVTGDVDLDFLGANLQTVGNRVRRYWLIVGGESGGGAEIMPLDSVTRIMHQAAKLGLPFFMKQFGSVQARAYGWHNKKGEDINEWPVMYRRRQFPFDGVRRCVGCGCHDFHACVGGCSWVGKDWCSKCANVNAGGGVKIPGEAPA